MSIELNIGLVLPDVLGTYGDDGNALVLRQRARLRGWKAEIHRINLGDAVPEFLDLYTVGGGDDAAQIIADERSRASTCPTARGLAARPRRSALSSQFVRACRCSANPSVPQVGLSMA